MSASFLKTLAAEVARMQTVHPERTGELARACALIANGHVTPSVDDPGIGQVLSSDLQTVYTINGSCSCAAGSHGKMCKHKESWLLYQYIAKKVEPEVVEVNLKNSLPEAAASVNMKVLFCGHEVMVTLRDDSEAALLTRLQTLLKRQDIRPVPKPAPRSGNWKKAYQGH
jgi:hypothetical protein